MTIFNSASGPSVSAYKTAVLADSPISYWRLNEAVGASTATDTQGVVNGTYQSAIANGIGRRGPSGDPTSGAIGLETGVSSTGITLPTTSAFNVASPFTVEFWVMTKTTAAATLVYLANPSGGSNGYGVGIGHTTAGQLDINENGTWHAGITVNDNVWHHIAVVYSASTAVTIYEDGASAGTVTLGAPISPYSGAGMKLLAPGASCPAVYMSEIAVYGSALSPARIAAHYAAMQGAALSDRVQLLTASAAWEDGGCVEPNLYWDGSKWCMIYRGGQHSTTVALGYATCTGSDPTIPGNWTKYASNPIIGGGAGGFSDHCYAPSIYIESGTLYVTFTDYATGDIWMASGADALHLGAPTKIFMHTTGLSANMWIVKNGSTYELFIEMLNGGTPNTWQIGYATSSTINGTYTFQSFFNLTADGQTDHGGPFVYLDGNGTYHLWYHGSGYSNGLPSQIYKTTTTDKSTFTTPILQVKRSHNAEYDQSADPQIVIPGQSGAPTSGPIYLLWDGDNNVDNAASIFISRSGIVPLAA